MRTTLKKDERILLVTRQHWLKMFWPLFSWVAIAVLLFIFIEPVTALIIAFITALYPAYLFLEWNYNLWAVTNVRVVDESGFFTRYSKESPLEKINNVEYDQTLFGRMFGFGDVRIQTAAEMGDTTYKWIHKPKLLKDTITHSQEEYKAGQIKAQAQQLATAIKSSMGSTPVSSVPVAAEIEKLFELLQKGAITTEEYVAQKMKLLGKPE